MEMVYVVPVIILIIYVLSSIKILAEYERGVISRLGHLLAHAKGPGVILVFAPIDRIVRVSLRQEALEVPPQDIITRDNVTVSVNAVVYFRVIDPRQPLEPVFAEKRQMDREGERAQRQGRGFHKSVWSSASRRSICSTV